MKSSLKDQRQIEEWRCVTGGTGGTGNRQIEEWRCVTGGTGNTGQGMDDNTNRREKYPSYKIRSNESKSDPSDESHFSSTRSWAWEALVTLVLSTSESDEGL